MKVKVEYIFSRNTKIGSWLIRKLTSFLVPGLSPIPSHVAILINGRWVHESVLQSGVRVMSYEKWSKKNIELYKMPCPVRSNRDYKDIKRIIRTMRQKPYDWLGVIYFGITILNYIVLNKEIPKLNRWHSDSKYFCSELIGELIHKSYEMYSPVQILDDLL